MRLLRTAAFIMLCMPIAILACEGDIYAAVYECNPIEITKVMENVCSSVTPERSAAAYSKWLARNSVRAELRANECSAELQARANPEGNQQRLTELFEQARQFEREMLEEFKGKVASHGVSVCDEALSQLETGCCGVDIK